MPGLYPESSSESSSLPLPSLSFRDADTPMCPNNHSTSNGGLLVAADHADPNQYRPTHHPDPIHEALCHREVATTKKDATIPLVEQNADWMLGGDNGNLTPHNPRHVSLARTPSTPRWATMLLPLLTILTQALFLYAQFAPMWRLNVYQNIDVWVNATSTTSKLTLDTLGLPRQNHIVSHRDKDARVFTYGYALRELWTAKKMPGKLLPRLTAVLLVLCSGLWPHLKLLLLNITFMYPMRSVLRRQRFLHWLSTLGKWSLADVLTVCVMLAVLNIRWIVDPAIIQQALVEEMPTLITLVREFYTANDLCTKLLKYDCSNAKKVDHATKCKACKSLVREAYTHPHWAHTTGKQFINGLQTSGGGVAQISVKGMRGIYAFSLAVIASIILSLVVDIFDARARRMNTRSSSSSATAAEPPPPDTATNTATTNTTTTVEPPPQAAVPLLLESYDNNDPITQQLQALTVETDMNPQSSSLPISDRVILQSDLLATLPSRRYPLEWPEDDSYGSNEPPLSFVYSQQSKESSWMGLILTIVSAGVVLLATLIPTMLRQAHGAIPIVLHDILGVNWERPYSFLSLMHTTGAAGGWDWLLMGTFAIFMVIGPIIRAVLGILVHGVIPRSSAYRPLVASAIDFIGAFCAWEVFFVAVVMTDMLMPTITGTIYHKDACHVISPDGSCFNVEFNVLKSFGWVMTGGFLLIFTSAMAVRYGKQSDATLLSYTYRDVNDDDEYEENRGRNEYQRLLDVDDGDNNP